MSDGTPKPFQVDHGDGVEKQIHAIKKSAKQAGKLNQLIGMLEKAVHLLRTDPHGWGDPVYRSKFVDGVYCHAMLWPISFRYVIYEEAHGVVLLEVRQIADIS